MAELTCPCGKKFTAPPSAQRKYCSQACYWRLGQPRNERKGGWKGAAVGYQALHDWIRREKGLPAQCQSCGATSGRIEWANVSHEYRRDLADWIALCRHCHRRHDSPTCKRGHERNQENTWVDRQGYPHCRPCRNERLRLQRRGQWTGPPSRSAIKDKYGKW